MLIAVVTAKNIPDARLQLQKISAGIQSIEWRLDFLQEIDLEAIAQIRLTIALPVIFTLRKKSQGGYFCGNEYDRLTIIEKVIGCRPDYFDLEHDVPLEFVNKLQQKNPGVALICSYHDFSATSGDLDSILDNMIADAFSYYKIVTFAQSTSDTLRMLQFVKRRANKIKLSGFCMGELGVPSRILAPVMGSVLHYACIAAVQGSAPGQLSVTTLIDTYQFLTLNEQTAVYALLGDPVSSSLGDIFHNGVFRDKHVNAVYVKLKISISELAECIILLRDLPFYGLSITMPLKEAILPHLDQVDQAVVAIGAANTIQVFHNKLIGSNTDGKGALDAVENTLCVKGETIVILGAGGTAKAIAYEAKQRGAGIIIVNRTLQKAELLAKQFNGLAYGFDALSGMSNLQCSILISTIPVLDEKNSLMMLLVSTLTQVKVIMDCCYNTGQSPLVTLSDKLGCQYFDGQKMFVNQAKRQQAIWQSDAPSLWVSNI